LTERNKKRLATREAGGKGAGFDSSKFDNGKKITPIME